MSVCATVHCMTGNQIRAGRALLDMSQAALASRAGLARNTVVLAEGRETPSPKAEREIRRTLAELGVRLLGDGGVQVQEG